MPRTVHYTRTTTPCDEIAGISTPVLDPFSGPSQSGASDGSFGSAGQSIGSGSGSSGSSGSTPPLDCSAVQICDTCPNFGALEARFGTASLGGAGLIGLSGFVDLLSSNGCNWINGPMDHPYADVYVSCDGTDWVAGWFPRYGDSGNYYSGGWFFRTPIVGPCPTKSVYWTPDGHSFNPAQDPLFAAAAVTFILGS